MTLTESTTQQTVPTRLHRGRRRAAAVAVALPLLALCTAAPALAHGGHTTAADGSVTIRLDAAPGSDANGTATLTPTADGGLTVAVTADGMVPNMPHAQHLHGDVTGHEFICPTADDDTDGNGFLTVEEGLPKYGGIHISLTTEGATAPADGLAVDRMPVADADGNLSYSRTLTAAELPDGTLDALANLHIVQHGVDANGNDEYDLDGLGESTFAASLGVQDIPSEATDVASCGMVVPAGGVETGLGTTGGTEDRGWLLAGLGTMAVGAVALGIRRRGNASAL